MTKFLNLFRSRFRPDPVLAVPSPDRVHFQPPPEDARPDPPDPRIVLSQWQHLGSLDPESHDYDELLRTLVDMEGNRKAAMKFTDNDAGIVINIIGEVSFCDMIDHASTTSYT